MLSAAMAWQREVTRCNGKAKLRGDKQWNGNAWVAMEKCSI